MSSFKYRKTLNNAIEPKKANPTDSGFDLCLVDLMKVQDDVYWYDTGIAVQPPQGYYFEVVGRSSISKSGYMLANNIGIIDDTYRGSIKVALLKVNKNAVTLELPARLVQLIPRQLILMDAVEVEKLEDTERGEGGFGSSGAVNTTL